MNQLTTIQLFAVWALPVLFAITVHEVAHGYVAYLLGDKTARALGRLTLNPAKHIDLVGTIIVPLILFTFSGFIIGWAKPVPINSRNFKKPRRDNALVGVAGPLANLFMAFLWAAIAKLGLALLHVTFPGAAAINYMGLAGIQINLMLLVLNLIPIPPLDGGHVLAGLLPRKLALKYEKITPYGFLIVLFLLAVGAINYILFPLITLLYGLITVLFGI